MSEPLRVLDTFAGIGGFSLGLERASPRFQTVAFCEIEPFCQRVLAKHWPGVPCYEDIKELDAARLRRDGIGVDIITGGFPCQDLSTAGKQAGIEAERSGLWAELCRLTGELRPRYAIYENVSALIAGDRGRWFGRVLGDLAAIGFAAEWHCISAGHISAPHIRDRVWIIARPAEQPEPVADARRGSVQLDRGPGDGARAAQESGREARKQRFRAQADDSGQDVADADEPGSRRHGQLQKRAGERAPGSGSRSKQSQWLAKRRLDGSPNGISAWLDGSWERGIPRVTTGQRDRVARLRALGNAIVPQIAELIGRAILEDME